MKILNDFAIWLIAYREDHRLKQDELGALIGVDGSAIGAWERGECSPNYANLCKISRSLKVPITEFSPEDCIKEG